MASYQTKLKVGRKLEGVDTSTASDNQISALFRFDEDTGDEDHVSLSIESDTMSAEDVFAVFQLLHDRGVLTAQQAKTWLHQPKASREAYGETKTWAGVDLDQKVSMLSKGLKVRSGSGQGAGSGTGAAAKMALVKVAEVEKKISELKQTLRAPGQAPEDAGSTPAPTQPTNKEPQEPQASADPDPEQDEASNGNGAAKRGPQPPNLL